MLVKNEGLILGAGLVLLSILLYKQNNDIVVNDIEYKNDKVLDGFKGYKIVHISDLHNKKFKQSSIKLINKIKEARPNIIVVTGDLIDSRITKMDVAIDFMKEISKIANVYYVPGNHEGRIKGYDEFEKKLESIGINILSNKSKSISVDKDSINLIGMNDITFIEDSNEDKFYKILKELQVDNKLNILLSHRPELIDIYEKAKIDLVFTGHAHGGQIRLPFVGGLFAPGQGLLPRFTNGMHKINNTSIIVSRGLGNSLFPFRIFNKPELVVVTLNKDNE